MNKRRIRAFLCIGILVDIIVFGTLGYMTVEGWSAFETFYITTIAFAFIGHSEAYPLTTGVQAFTTLVIFGGVGLGTVALGLLVPGDSRGAIYSRS